MTSLRSRIGIAASLLACSVLLAIACSDKEEVKKDPAWEAGDTFREPPRFQPDADGVYQLALAPAEVQIDGKRYCMRSYNGSLTGPTLRLPASEEPRRIRLDFHNRLTGHDFHKVGNSTSHHGDHGGEDGYDFNATNLHTHGLHVRPDKTADGAFTSDDVLLTLQPGESRSYRFDVDEAGLHEAGTFWYHAHVHGTTAIHVANGMAGALIIEGAVDALPGIREAGDRLFVFQQIPYNMGKPLEDGEACDESRFSINDFSIVTRADRTLVNGILRPSITVPPGHVERWRFVHAGITQMLRIGVRPADPETGCAGYGAEGLSLHQIARDGITFDSKEARADITMAPGYRVDVMIEAPATEGTWCVVDLQSDPLNLENEEPANLLAVLQVDARAGKASGALPSDEDLAKVATPTLDCETPMEVTQEVVFAQQKDAEGEDCEGLAGGAPFFNINCKEFDPHHFRTLELGATEAWELRSELAGHPFHIHVNPFTVCGGKVHGEELPKPRWMDTVFVRQGEPVSIRSTYEDFTGPFVLHCHLLQHEDQGMMEMVEIVKATP